MSLMGHGDWLNRLAQMNEASSPDGRLKLKMKAEKDAIVEALRTVGEYVMEFDGQIIVIRAEERIEG